MQISYDSGQKSAKVTYTALRDIIAIKLTYRSKYYHEQSKNAASINIYVQNNSDLHTLTKQYTGSHTYSKCPITDQRAPPIDNNRCKAPLDAGSQIQSE